ncbi:alpha/beta hydrolase [Bacteroidota bacterium]
MKKILISISFAFLFLTVVAGQTDFSVSRDVSYKTGDSYTIERCILDIRYPDKQGAFPVVIWFHGGGLTGGNKYFPKELLEEDIVLVAANYRLSPKIKVVEIIDDAAAAIAWVFGNIAQYGGDPSKIIVSGHSAGGYLTSMIGLDKKWLEGYDIDANDINALFPFSGHAITHFAVRKEMDIQGKQPIIDEMAPLYFVRNDAPPFFLMTGDRELELLGRYEENAYMWRMMKVAGHEASYLFEFDGHNHGAMVAPGCHVMLEYINSLNSN